jgi:diguanylate cyclase (GGDEF)-like protein
MLMTSRLTVLIAHAAQGPGSRPVRFSLAALTLAQAVALMASTRLQTAGGPSWETDVVVAAALNVLVSLALVAAPWHALSDRGAAVAAGAALALGTSSAVLATGGSSGLLNLAIPVAAFLAAVMFPWRHTAVIGAAMIGSYFIGTYLHGELDFRSWYELVEALLVTMVVLVGTTGMKHFLMTNAEILSEQNEELDARVRELTAVSSLARLVGATADRGSMLRQGLRMALEATACDAGILFLVSEDGSLEPHHWVGLSDQVGTALCRKASLGDRPGVATWAVGGSGPVVVPDVTRWSYAGDTDGAAETSVGIQGSLTAVPMAVEGTPFGALVVIDSRGLLPMERGMTVLETVAGELALAVDRQHHVDEGERQRRQLETLHGIARRATASLKAEEVLKFAVEETAALVDADVVYIATLKGRRRRLRVVAQHGLAGDGFLGLEIEEGQGIGGRVVIDRGIVQTEDYCADPRLEHPYGDIIRAEGLRTIIGLPLVNRNRVVGVFYAARRQALLFRAPEIVILEMLSSQIAVALENARLFEDVRQKSIHDPLTGIFNRRLFERRLGEEERRAARYGRPLSLLMIDVDDFKRYNDTYGHTKGDELLRELVAATAGAIRNTDVLARYGGEEFVVLLPETDLPEAAQAGERIRAAVRDRFGLKKGDSSTITVSVGVAALSAEYSGAAGMVERADAAMYRAKRQGKDRVSVDGPACDGVLG